MIIFIIFYVIFFALLMVTSYNQKYRRYYVPAKALTSLVFVLAAFFNMKGQFSWTWMAAFIFCFLGDVFLGLDEKKNVTANFILGLSSFVLGHLFFIMTIDQIVKFHFKDLIVPIGMMIFTFFLTKHPKFHVKDHKIPILIYSVIVSLLCVKGIDIFQYHPSCLKIMIGAFLFCISDFILLFMYFYEDKVKILKFLNLLTYYSATMLLAMSVICVG